MAGNLGPLPTDFTVPANCASELSDIYLFHTSVNSNDPSAYYLLQGALEQTLCYPGSYTANTEQYYSPARCPTGFTAPCQSINRAGTVEETVLTCCPTLGDYACQTDIHKVWESTQGCRSRIGVKSSKLVLSEVSSGVTSRVTTTFGANDAVNAYSIQVRYQSTDFISTSSSSPTPSSARETQSPTVIPANTPTNIPHSTTSSGAIAGIVVGVLIAISIAIVAIFLFKRRHRHRQLNLVQQTHHPPHPYPQHPSPYQPNDQQQQNQHFGPFKINSYDPPAVLELDAYGAIELDSRTIPPRNGT